MAVTILRRAYLAGAGKKGRRVREIADKVN
jgi:hypothetical protein